MLYSSFHYWLIDNIEHGSSVLELGSGKGTRLLCKYFQMHSIEHDKNWIGLADTNYIYAPIRYNWYDVGILKKELKNIEYNAFIIDGPPGTIGRFGAFSHINLFKQDVPYILDDVNRPAELFLTKKIAQRQNRNMEIFKGKGKNFAVIL